MVQFTDILLCGVQPHNMARASTAAKARHRKTNTGTGKRGQKSHFHGARAAFIAEQFPEFLIAQGGGRGLQKQFWFDFYSKWWDNFHWRVPLHEEPAEDAEHPDTEEEEEDGKAKTVNQTQVVSIIDSVLRSPANTILSASRDIFATWRTKRRARHTTHGRDCCPTSESARTQPPPLASSPTGSCT